MCPDQPCVRGCPVNIAIPDFILKITEKDFRGAYDSITATNLLPAVCGRVCPQENQCEGVCTVGDTLEPVAIGRLERWVGDLAIKEGWSNVPYIERNAFRVGIVGSGPAGMACAADMAKAGCEVTVYEAFHEAGRRPQVRHPRLPPAEHGRGRRDRQAPGARRSLRVQHAGGATLHHRADDRGNGIPRGVRRHRRGLPELHGDPGREPERRALGQRTAHALQPDARARVPELRHADAAGQKRGRDRRGQHGHGCAARLPATRGRARALPLPPQPRRGARAGRGNPPRRGRRHRVPLAREPGGDPGRRQPQRACRALRAHDPRRARRLRAPATRPRAGQRVRDRGRHGRVRDRHQRQPDHRADVAAEARQARLHSDRRALRHLDPGRVRRRRHRDGCRDGDRGHGCGPSRGARHEGFPWAPRHRFRLHDPQTGPDSMLFGIDRAEHGYARVRLPR